MKGLWIVGGSGAALEAWAVARAMTAHTAQPWRLRGFLVAGGGVEFDPEELEIEKESVYLDRLNRHDSLAILAVGDPALRARISERYTVAQIEFATLIHPSAVVGPHCQIGQGSIVMASAVLETHVAVGMHALINVGSSVAHNGILGDCCNLGPGARLAGWVTLGDQCDVGVGACIRPRITLGPRTRVGCGAAVVKDYPGEATLIGNPAKPMDNH